MVRMLGFWPSTDVFPQTRHRNYKSISTVRTFVGDGYQHMHDGASWLTVITSFPSRHANSSYSCHTIVHLFYGVNDGSVHRNALVFILHKCGTFRQLKSFPRTGYKYKTKYNHLGMSSRATDGKKAELRSVWYFFCAHGILRQTLATHVPWLSSQTWTRMPEYAER